MKLRAQLALAFLLLAVLPLGGIVLYSYVSSERAFRQAVWAESQGLADEMAARLATARQQIRDRLTELGDLSGGVPAPSAGSLEERVRGRLGRTLLPYVDSVEVHAEPAPPGAPAVPLHLPHIAPRQTPQTPVPPVDLPPEAKRQIAAALRQTAAIEKRLSEGREPSAVPDLAQSLVESPAGDLSSPIRAEGQVVGHILPHIKMHALLGNVFAVRRDQGEVPFALDTSGRLYVTRPEDKERLAGAVLSCDPAQQKQTPTWVVVTKKDPEAGLCYGVARPIRHSLAAMRGAAMRNFAYGLGLAGLCALGIFPLTGRITRNLSGLMAGVERLTRGDLSARVPVRSRDEFGRLGEAFNRMAAQLHDNQARLLEEERRRKEQEIERRLLEAENARKSGELEQARRFQLSLLPREVPRRTDLELAAYVRTATEVGGDYYDFLPGEDGSLTIAIGDATGHGATAGTMVTVVKGLFTARAGVLSPAAFLGHANEVIRRMQLGRMAMALTVLRIHDGRLTVAAAGMPPLLIHRAQGGAVEEVCLNATPLGSLADAVYPEREAELAPGDTLLLMTDGLPELLSPAGDPLGYPRATEIFAAAAGQDPEAVIADLTAAGESWSAGAPLHDDVTFVVVKVR